MKAGIAFADAVTTVSERYAEEIKTKEFGCGLEGLLTKRKRDVHGILNGIDLSIWDPLTDINTVRKYDAETIEVKEECKKDLCSAMDLPYEEGKPVIGIIARFVDQKGIHLLTEIMENILKAGAQLVILGSGEKKYEDFFTKQQKKHPKQIAVQIGFHDNFAHKIEAGSDIFIMPSAYEPCGLNQMYSMRYGTVPVVRNVGGLADTVIDAAEGTKKKPATGFVFDTYDAKSFWKALERALTMYKKQPKQWRELQLNGMARDFSWNNSAHKYAELYEKLLAQN
jgi:starch synthase